MYRISFVTTICITILFRDCVHGMLPTNDEFDNAQSLTEWTNENPAMVDSLTISNGNLVLIPAVQSSNVWYNTWQGTFLSKSVTGNFMADISLHVYVPPNSNPTGNWHSAGLLAWDSNANWVVQNIGHQGAWSGVSPTAVDGTETKTNVNSASTFNYRAATSPPLQGLLRLCRVGSNFTALRWLDGEMGWSMDTPFPGATPAPINRPDFSDTIKIGIMANRLGNAANLFQADIDYIRFTEAPSESSCLQPPIQASSVASTVTSETSSTTTSSFSTTQTSTTRSTTTTSSSDTRTNECYRYVGARAERGRRGCGFAQGEP
eukprot:m.8964 g.8964  ORF g.8964 m.8964 type:complete len:319 (+) comp3983_c0_seq2:915-1871(+)